jgi:hypothetical protein
MKFNIVNKKNGRRHGIAPWRPVRAATIRWRGEYLQLRNYQESTAYPAIHDTCSGAVQYNNEVLARMDRPKTMAAALRYNCPIIP